MQQRHLIAPLLALFALLALGACTEEKIVYRDREPFNPPPDQQSGFLGYFTRSTKQTTCGNCHVGHQRDWKTTAHAGAWATLVGSGSQQAFCNACHTVSHLGNATASPAGYARVADSAYHDVQCESCHGPGYTHVIEPDISDNAPLARASLTDASASCAACHSGAHHPFAEEWAQSGHARVEAYPAGRPECASCHDGKATLQAWGANVNYVERDETGFLEVTCAVCHNPHGRTGHPKQLRFAVSSPDPDQQLCMKCHARRGEPVVSSSRGPHAPQGLVLLGLAGYKPPGFGGDTNAILTSHGPAGNPGLCATCHVGRFEVADPQTGGFLFQATGHLFRPIPCVDAQGIPTADNSCAYTETARSFKSCTGAGCHTSVGTARSAFTAVRTRLSGDVRRLWVDVDGDQVVDPFPSGPGQPGDSGYLAKVMLNMPGEFTLDERLSPAEGALFNARLFGEGLYDNTDDSKGVHNPFLAELLLLATIAEMEQEYAAFLPAPRPELRAADRTRFEELVKRTSGR